MAAAIVLLLTISFVTDTISLSMLGYTPSPASVLPKYSAEYRSMAGTAISGNDWREFGNRVRPVMLRIRRKIESNQSRTSDEERNLKATLTMLRLVNLRAGDKEKQSAVFAEMQELLGGA